MVNKSLRAGFFGGATFGSPNSPVRDAAPPFMRQIQGEGGSLPPSPIFQAHRPAPFADLRAFASDFAPPKARVFCGSVITPTPKLSRSAYLAIITNNVGLAPVGRYVIGQMKQHAASAVTAPEPKPDASMSRKHPPPKGRDARGRSNRKRSRPAEHLDLLELTRRGAVLQRHQFWAVLRSVLAIASISGALQAVTYAVYVSMRSSTLNTLASGIVCAMLFALSFIASLLLAALRRRRLSYMATALITLIVFNLGAVVLSAARIPISYSGLLLCLPLALAGMLVAARHLQRGSLERIGLLDFPGADDVIALFGERAVSKVIEPVADNLAFDRILIDGKTHHSAKWSRYLTIASMRGVEVMPWEAEYEWHSGMVNIATFDFSHLAYSPEQLYYTRAKRVLDLVLLVLSLPVVFPLGALVWLYIRIIDGGPSIFVQTRRGYAGRYFRMLKFRTMRLGAQGGATGPADTRILPGCRLLRRFRIDELPQLINIWRGEMSWIGPRPESMELAQRYEREIPEYAFRLLALPGLSGWAQVNHGYTSTVLEARTKLAYDLYYLKNISFDLDLEITVRTIKTLFARKGTR